MSGKPQWSKLEQEAIAEAAAYMDHQSGQRRGLVAAEIASKEYHLDLQYGVDQFSDLTDVDELEEKL